MEHGNGKTSERRGHKRHLHVTDCLVKFPAPFSSPKHTPSLALPLSPFRASTMHNSTRRAEFIVTGEARLHIFNFNNNMYKQQPSTSRPVLAMLGWCCHRVVQFLSISGVESCEVTLCIPYSESYIFFLRVLYVTLQGRVQISRNCSVSRGVDFATSRRSRSSFDRS